MSARVESQPRASKHKGRFVNHGIPAPVSESHGVIAAADAQGNPMLLAMAFDGERTSLLLIDARSGKTRQYWYPDKRARTGSNYCLMLGAAGKAYVMLGSTFLEFDTNERKWTFAKDAKSGTAMSLTEGPDGTIYAATFPDSRLLAFNPKTRKIRKLGRLDPVEKYPTFLETDSAGWVYAGIGTTHSNLVAFNPETKERRQIVKESDRQVGTGQVRKGRDGHVYGRLAPRQPWLRLFKGKAVASKKTPRLALVRSVYAYGKNFNRFPDGSKLAKFDMPGKVFEVVGPQGEANVVHFDYASSGAMITSMIAGPKGRLYGSTAHPFRLFSYDPKSDVLTNYGGLKKVGGGNFCGLAVHGNTIFGASYARGYLYAFDVTRPWKDSEDGNANPKIVGQFHPEITRPRTALAHPDQRHIIMAGYAGYGYAGGGMAFYDVKTGKAALLTHKKIVPGHSTVTVKALADGSLVGGTSIDTPGGADPVSKTGRLYIMDWSTRKVVFETEPVPGAQVIHTVAVGPCGKVFGITNTSQLFVFDPDAKKVIHRADLKEFGAPPREDKTLILHTDGSIYAVLDESILRISTKSYKHRKVAALTPPATSGIAICEDRLYYAAVSSIWSYRLNGR